MKQCPGCKTAKKADNCISCAKEAYGQRNAAVAAHDLAISKTKRFESIINLIGSIIFSPMNDNRKMDRLEKLFKGPQE